MLFYDFSDIIYLNPPNLAFALNLIFWSIATISISYISAKSFLKEGSAIVLVISCSIIVLGLSLIISGWVTDFSGNYSVAIANIGIFASSVLQVLCGILSITGKTNSKVGNSLKTLISIYIVTIVFVLALSVLVCLDYVPTFYTASGPTLLRQTVLGSGIIFFAIACILFIGQYLKSKASSLYWYALAIGLISVSLSSTFEVKVLGDLPTWLGRIGLYIGTIYLIAAILSTKRKAEGTDRASAWAEAFKTNPEQFEALFSNMLDAFIYGKIIVDQEGKPFDWTFLDVNDSYCKITGFKKEQVIGKKVSELYPDEQRDPTNWIGKYGHVALTGEPTHFEGYRLSLKKWLHVSSYSPKKGYFVAIFEDITERKKTEQMLEENKNNLERLVEQRTKQLKDAERLAAIGATAGMVGHDIRNPLQAITSDVFLVKSELADFPETENKRNAIESLNEIESNIDYINKIVADLQDFARPLNPREQEANIKAIVEETISKQKRPKGLKVVVDIQDEAQKLMADPDYMKRIISNLVLNAIQAMPNGGKLTVKANIDMQSGEYFLSVEDTGVGIADDVKDKLFTPMFTTKAKGQGFGLAVVKRMTETLGGTVVFDSQPAKGTKFIIRLPPQEAKR